MSTQPGKKDDADFIQWNPKFETGIPTIDAQHKKLVALCNNLRSAIMKNSSPEGLNWEGSLASALRECTDYVQTHFHDEEVLMKAAGYDGLERHKKEHEAFTRKVRETAQNFSTISVTGAIQFVKFLYDWILSHIAHEDMLFAKPVMDYYRANKDRYPSPQKEKEFRIF